MPDTDLKIAVIPHNISLGDVDVNLREVAHALTTIDHDTDLIVLPEMFSTGYTTDRERLRRMAEKDNGQTISTVREWSSLYGFAIWGGFIGRVDDNFFNRGFMIQPDGSGYFYNKHHLFTMGGEGRLLQRGSEEAPIVTFRSWKLKMAICYDIRFPIWNRNKDLAYDALIVPANWAHSRAFAWQHILIARAIENQAYIIGCNRSGKDDYGEYLTQDTLAYNHLGKEISQRRSDGIVTCVLDANKLNNDRTSFPVWRDADSFNIY